MTHHFGSGKSLVGAQRERQAPERQRRSQPVAECGLQIIVQCRALQPCQQAKTLAGRCRRQRLVVREIGPVGTPDRRRRRARIEIAGAAGVTAPELPRTRGGEEHAVNQFAMQQGACAARAERARADGFGVASAPRIVVHVPAPDAVGGNACIELSTKF